MTGWIPPWPAEPPAPRWARDRQGRLRQPDEHFLIESTGRDRQHVALYNGLFRQWLAVIADPAAADDTTDPTAARVRLRCYLWPFGYRALKAVIRHHLHPDHPDRGQAGPSPATTVREVVVVKEQR